jgi:hypothetical protein
VMNINGQVQKLPLTCEKILGGAEGTRTPDPHTARGVSAMRRIEALADLGRRSTTSRHSPVDPTPDRLFWHGSGTQGHVTCGGQILFA